MGDGSGRREGNIPPEELPVEEEERRKTLPPPVALAGDSGDSERGESMLPVLAWRGLLKDWSSKVVFVFVFVDADGIESDGGCCFCCCWGWYYVLSVSTG